MDRWTDKTDTAGHVRSAIPVPAAVTTTARAAGAFHFRALVLLVLLVLTLPAFAAERAVCAVCGPREGSGFEPVRATATLKGKQYYFCSRDSEERKTRFYKNSIAPPPRMPL
jgi:hypothetical protein